MVKETEKNSYNNSENFICKKKRHPSFQKFFDCTTSFGFGSKTQKGHINFGKIMCIELGSELRDKRWKQISH